MILDKELTFSLAQVVTASAASTDFYDQGVANSFLNYAPMYLLINIDEAATASGSATVSFALEQDDNAAFSSPVAIYTSGAIAKATMVPGYQLIIPVPAAISERYLRVYYTVATGPLTAGKFTATMLPTVQSTKAYADAI